MEDINCNILENERKYSIEYLYKNKMFKATAVLKEVLSNNMLRFKTDRGYDTLFTSNLILLKREQILTIEKWKK